MLKIKKISEVMGRQVYTSDGDYLGVIEEANLVDNKVEGWRIRVGGGFAGSMGGARGVIVPHQFVKSIGDVFVVNASAFKGSFQNKEESVDVGTAMNDSDTLV